MDLRHLREAAEAYGCTYNMGTLTMHDLLYIIRDAEMKEEKEAIEGLTNELTDVGQPDGFSNRAHASVNHIAGGIINDPITQAITKAAHGKTDVEKVKEIKSILVVFFREGSEGDYFTALKKAINSIDSLTTK